MTGYFIGNAILAGYVLYDGYKRDHPKKWLYTLGSLLASWLLLPFYEAGKPLKDGEVREGGYGWNVTKNYALYWTIIMVFIGVSFVINAGEVAETAHTDAEQVGAGLGIAMGLMAISAAWFLPMFGALVIGLFLKKNSIVEEGPTGPLSETSAETVTSDEPDNSGFCPGCGEAIDAEAAFCPNCGSEL